MTKLGESVSDALAAFIAYMLVVGAILLPIAIIMWMWRWFSG
jgi:hypothetical protein